MATFPSDLLHTLPVFLHTQTSLQTKDILFFPTLCDKSRATFISVPARTRRSSSSAALFCIFIRVVLRKRLPLMYLIKGKARREECWGGTGVIMGVCLSYEARKTWASKVQPESFQQLRTPCFLHVTRALGAEPRPSIDVHVDFDVAPPSARGGLSGSRATDPQRCVESVAVTWSRQDNPTLEASEKFY